MAQLTGHVLLVDDDPAVGKVLGALLAQAGIEAHHVSSAQDALNVLGTRPVDVVVTDLRMPGMDGMQLLDQISARWPDIPTILLTAHGSVPLAVEAMKKGAADFVLKPFDREEILYSVRKALTKVANEEQAPEPGAPGAFVGGSPAMKEVYDLIRKAASGNATVLLRGESGSGKELAARAVHEQSARKNGPFVKVHCAALPDSLLESELFGYEKGAFTGAASRKPGRVELAQGGTLFLDEIGDITPQIQVKLLRLLQDREFERLGGTETLKADLRFVAATHRPLEQMIQKNEFREDLFYRLNVVPIVLPPLRQRPEDIEPLTAHFVKTLGAANGKPGAQLERAALELILMQSWPGNVRQLQNFVERLVVLNDDKDAVIRAADVQRELSRTQGLSGAPPPGAPAPAGAPAPTPPGTLDEKRREAEREALLDALKRAGDNRTLAARLLGVSRRTLYNKLEEHGLL
jgi:two-component system response regulator AtoC